jgi:hypothetical protein
MQYKGVKRLFHPAKYLKRSKKEEKYIKWQYNQVVDVRSPIFTISMVAKTKL